MPAVRWSGWLRGQQPQGVVVSPAVTERRHAPKESAATAASPKLLCSATIERCASSFWHSMANTAVAEGQQKTSRGLDEGVRLLQGPQVSEE